MTTTQNFGPKGWTPERLGSLAGKTYVITGTTTGTGYEATKIFLSKGAKVVMLNRNGNKSAAVIANLKKEFGSDADVSFIHMDLSMLNSVRRAAAEVLEKVPHIDALINNAAIAQLAKREITIDGFECHFAVNHYGHFLLTGLLFDRIEKSSGRIVIVGSAAYKQGLKRIQFEDLDLDKNYTPWDAYAHSKLAEMMFGYELQRRVKSANKNVEIQVCHPGGSRTDLIKGENVSVFVRTLWDLLSPIAAQSAEKGSYPEVMCATEEGLKQQTLYGPTRRAETVGPVDENQLAKHALNQVDAAKLWTISEQKTSLIWSL